MDQHPIPQDVTGFQFKLIGSMTVKQFGYVAVGVISAIILYYLPWKGPLALVSKIIFIPILGASGVVLAFVPIEGRPIDVMVTNFMKGLFSPNQYIYRKVGRRFSFSTVSLGHPQAVENPENKKMQSLEQRQLYKKSKELQKLLLQSSESKIRNKLDEREMSFLQAYVPSPNQYQIHHMLLSPFYPLTQRHRQLQNCPKQYRSLPLSKK
jgi:hypothetical protein